jgi:hypothetical protein
MSAQPRARERRAPPRNAQAAQQPALGAVSSSGASSDKMTPPQSALPSITLGQLKLLTGRGAQLGATIRATDGGYRIEVDLWPRRRQLVSTHRKRPRLFRGLDGAANAARDLGPQHFRLELTCA